MQDPRSLTAALVQGSVVALLAFLAVGWVPGMSFSAGPTPPTEVNELGRQSHRSENLDLQHQAGRAVVVSPTTRGDGAPGASPEGQQTFLAGADADVLQGYPGASEGSATQIWAGYDDSLSPQGQIARGLVWFDIASLPPGKVIINSRLRLRLVSARDYPDTPRTITTHRITSNWSEGTVTWNSKPGYQGAFGSKAMVRDDWAWHDFDVTSLVDAWYRGIYPNQGIMVRGPEASGTDSSWRGFGTREGSYPPQLVVEYSDKPGGDGQALYLPFLRSPNLVVSQLIRTGAEGVVEHPGGASISVPRGAVPASFLGGEGEMLFTIERGTPEDFGVPSAPPAGWEMLGDIFSMGPEGFIFNTPVKATIALPEDFDRTQQVASMFDYDFEEGRWESVGGQANADGELTADSLHLCANVPMARSVSGKGPGAIKFQGINGYSFHVCIEEYTLKYPGWDSDFEVRNRFATITRRDASTAPPDGIQHWVLPQGTYDLGVMVYYHREDDRPPEYMGAFARWITLDHPHWNWQTGGPDFEFTELFGQFEIKPDSLVQGRPPCAGTPTPSVGVGAVNVRLEWWDQADLDLWIVDPCGNRIIFTQPPQVCQGSVGQLDQDNRCGDGFVGQPENVYWAQNPPRGTYKVYVDYFEDCGGGGSVQFTVRWWLNGNTHVRRGNILPPTEAGAKGDEILVAQFSR